jgi:TolB-like protein/DNA-binding winged helix-turn-helix (wHTH) protein/Tfp pilus assembly protein PilF
MALPARVRFGVYEANLRSRILYRGDEVVRLQEKPFQVLAALLENAGNLVTREQIRARVWPDEESLDFDANLNTALNKLRRALGDVRDQPVFIRTIPRSGYRFIAPTTVLPEDPGEKENPEALAAAARTPARERESVPAPAVALKSGHQRWVLAGFGALLLGLIALAVPFARPYVSWAFQPARGRTVLLVLPFDSPGGDAADANFAGGLADELITRLSGVNPGHLGVIARTTAAQYRNAHKTAEQIGRELHVDYLLEGTVRRDGERERVFLWLVRTRDQMPVWAETYDRASHDSLSAEDGISSHVAAILTAKFFGEAAASAREPEPSNPAAREDYLEGRYFWNRLASSDLEKALTLFQSAIQKDPSYAEAYAGVAETYAVLADWTLRPPAQTLPAARDAARTALEHDSSLAEARAVLGVVAWQYDHDWSQADEEFSRALQLSSTNAAVHQWRGEYLAALGRFPDAEAEMERARQLDPLSRFISTDVGYTYYLGRDYGSAVAAFQRALELDPDFYAAHIHLAWTYMEQGRGKEAGGEFLRLLEFNRQPADVITSFRSAAAGGDVQAINRWILDSLLKRMPAKYSSPWRIATCYAALGEKDKAFQWLEKAMEGHDPQIARLRVDPMLDPLRTDPRFQGYLDRLNLRSPTAVLFSPALQLFEPEKENAPPTPGQPIASRRAAPALGFPGPGWRGRSQSIPGVF